MRRTTMIAALGLTLLGSAAARADEAAGHYNLALQFKREGNVVGAIGECETAVNLRPDYAAAHFTLGNLYRAQGNYARAAGEYGSVVFIAGNMPMKTEIVPLLIITKLEQYDYRGATAVAVVMLVISFFLLLAINGLQRWSNAGRVR